MRWPRIQSALATVVVVVLVLMHCSWSLAAPTDGNDDDHHQHHRRGLSGLDDEFRLSLTISARRRYIEISWTGLPPNRCGTVFLTAAAVPLNTTFVSVVAPTTLQADDQYYAVTPNAFAASSSDSSASVPDTFNRDAKAQHAVTYRTAHDDTPVLHALRINTTVGWHTTAVHFNHTQFPLGISTACYGNVRATFVPDDDDGVEDEKSSSIRRQQTCMRAHPRWMNEMREHIGAMRMRDLFLVGTHDSGSYRAGFDPRRNETRVSKYTLTQDDDIYAQLMLGVRYLDIRVGSYRTAGRGSNANGGGGGGAGDDDTLSTDGDVSGRQFWVNHGISRLQPLNDVLRQVRDFVLATDEIVIFDVQEFPIGFEKAARHRELVHYVERAFHDVLVSAELSWNATLATMWRTGGRVIVSYDHQAVVEEFGDVVFQAVQQRWGDMQTVGDLVRYLAPSSRNFVLYTARPFADMAEMTPTPWDVLTDKLGGLRRMADETNRVISPRYAGSWGAEANVVAVDFVRGTTLMESSLRWNARRSVQ